MAAGVEALEASTRGAPVSLGAGARPLNGKLAVLKRQVTRLHSPQLLSCTESVFGVMLLGGDVISIDRIVE